MIRRIMTLFTLTTSSLLITILAILTLAQESVGASLCVNTTGGGGCYTKIQDAIDNGIPGDTILVSAGTYTEHITMTNGISIYGEGFDNTVINGNHTSAQSTVYIEPGVSASTILSGVHVIGGGASEITGSVSANLFGGGIGIWYASPTIINTWVSNNTARQGGGIYVNRGAPTFENVPVWWNVAERGGGIYVDSATVTMTGVLTDNVLDTNGTVWWNTATIEGGGIYLQNATGTINGLRVWWNEADTQASTSGGGIYVYGNSPIAIQGNWIGGNSSRAGGGFSSYAATNLKIMDNLFLENSAEQNGGGLRFIDSSGLLENNLIISNTINGDFGGGAYVLGSTGEMTIQKNLFQGNQKAPVGIDNGGKALINANTFVNNEGNIASGIRLYQSGAVTVTNNILAQNQANFGAAVYVSESSPVRLINNTVTENDGEGIYFDNAPNIVIVNNIVYNNTDNGLAKNPADSSVYTLDYNDVYDNKGSGPDYAGGLTPGAHDVAIDPLFVATGNNITAYYHLQPSSPVNSNGSTTWAPTTDIDEQVRLSDGTVSIGADEYVSAALAVVKYTDQQNVQPGDSLTYTIVVTNTGDIDFTATITDDLPSQVTPNASQVWTTTIPALGGVWTQTVNVTVNEGYTGVLTNVVRVSTDQNVSGIYTHTLLIGSKVYLPFVVR